MVKKPVIPLAREWRFQADPNDSGAGEEWFRKDLGGSIRLTGTITTSKLGNPVTGIRQKIWGGDFTDKPVLGCNSHAYHEQSCAIYTGALRPVTSEHFRDIAKQEGGPAQVPDFVEATGRLSQELYKEYR